MSSPTDTAPTSEPPIPSHLKALFELERDAHASWSEYWKYGIVFSLAISYGFLVMSSHSPTVAFGGALVVVFLLQGVDEKRNRRRQQLLVEVLYGLQHAQDESKRA